jgi:hypothetical protein
MQSVNVPASVSLTLPSGSKRSYRRKSYGRRRSSSRSYRRGGRLSYYQKRAIARKAYVRGKWPSSEFAHPYVRRGSAAAQALGLTPGQTYAEASAENQALRKSIGWYGRGAYTGRGGYIGKIVGGTAAGLAAVAGTAGAAIFGDGEALAGMAPTVIQASTLAGAAAGSEFEDWLRDKMAGNMAHNAYNLGVAQNMTAFGSTAVPEYYTASVFDQAFSGRGDYTSMNSLVNGGGDSVVPKFAPDGSSVTISNVEYVKDIYAPGTNTPFSISAFAINPGLPVAFPWLSQIAANYQEYELMQCIYTFKSTIADFAAASGQVGQVIMATQYNPSLEVFADKETMMMYEGSMSCKTSSSMLQGVECDPAKLAATTGRKYVRTGNVSSSEDLKEYDQGVLNIALLNPPTTYLGQVMGELWVSYTVTLRKPRLNALNGNSIPSDVFCYYNQAGVSKLNNANYFSDDLQLSGPRNSFGARMYASPQLIGLGVWVQPPSGPGSASDPLDIFAAEVPTPISWSGTTAPPTIWVTGPTPQSNYFAIFYCLELPDNFQGVAQIVYTQYGRLGAGPNDPEMCELAQPLAAGNVYRFKDMPERTASGYDIRYSACKRIANDANNAGAPTDPSWNGITQTLHIRCQPATNGIKNRVYFGALCTSPAVQPSWIPVLQQCEVSVYNGTNSSSLTGKADRLQLQYTQSGVPYTTI